MIHQFTFFDNKMNSLQYTIIMLVCISWSFHDDIPIVDVAAEKMKLKRDRSLAGQFKQGTVFTDYHEAKWKIGRQIGRGGFGFVYLGNSMF